MHVWKRQGGRFISLPFPPRIDEARPSQRGAGAVAAPPSARVPSREKVKGGGGEKASYCSSSSPLCRPLSSRKRNMAPHPNGERPRGENRAERQGGKACRNEIDRGQIGNATGIRREIRR